MEKRIPSIFKILKNEGKLTKVLIYLAQEVENDPTEHTKDLNYLQSIAIDALIRDVSPEALHWKYYGAIPIGSKELIIEKRFKNTIKACRKIQIGEDYYKVYKDDSKGFNIIERKDYLVVIAFLES